MRQCRQSSVTNREGSLTLFLVFATGFFNLSTWFDPSTGSGTTGPPTKLRTPQAQGTTSLESFPPLSSLSLSKRTPKSPRLSPLGPSTLRQAQGIASSGVSPLSLSKRAWDHFVRNSPHFPFQPFDMIRPFDRLRGRRPTNQAQNTVGSRHHKFRVLPTPKFVEPVETNPEVTSAFAPRPFDS